MKPLHNTKKLEHVASVYTISYDETPGDRPMLAITRREEDLCSKCVSFHGEEAKNIFTKLDTIFQALLSD